MAGYGNTAMTYGPPAEFRKPEPEGEVVTIYCESNPNYRLMMREDGVVLGFKNLEDPKQHWIKVDVGDKFKDQEGSPGFALVNRATGHALSHGLELGDLVTGKTYQGDALDNAILWSTGKDEGKGYKAIRLVTNIHLNLDAERGIKKLGGVKDGTRLLIHTWNKQDNQKWKIVPLSSED